MEWILKLEEKKNSKTNDTDKETLLKGQILKTKRRKSAISIKVSIDENIKINLDTNPKLIKRTKSHSPKRVVRMKRQLVKDDSSLSYCYK
jgi:hypothetical protein